jgi:filamentous hemagglutinin
MAGCNCWPPPMSASPGRMPTTQSRPGRVLRYDNPNERGVNFIKFDGVETAKDGSMLLLLDAKIKLPLWSDSTKREILNTMQRVKTAIEQNPGYKVVYEFPNAKVERQAAEFIRESLFDDIVTTRVRKP